VPTKPKTNYKTDPNESNPQDRFQTPGYAVDPLIPYLDAAGIESVWEPAAGEGYLARALERHEFEVIAGDLLTGADYFDDHSVPAQYDCQVTNPPFGAKYPWIARAVELGRPFALLVPSDVLFAGARAQPLIKRYGLELLIPDKRINFKTPARGWQGSSAQMHTSWLCYRLQLGAIVRFCTVDPKGEI